MKHSNTPNYWLMALQGLLLLVFGVAALANPGGTLKVLVRIFGLTLVVTGMFFVYHSKNKPVFSPQFWFYEGLFNMVLGLFLMVFPSVVMNFFIILLGLTALLSGILNITTLVKSHSPVFTIDFIRSALAVVIGLILVFNPWEGNKAVMIIIGSVSLIIGALSLYATYKLINHVAVD